ncbi:hypothetical protein LCGC14_0777450 [marine sediment metagenome]|uniref:Uncharacterized protein n=1 Tax=marine sediment metagenome TaxID=412755 RepID=A0A0F9PWP2_9ZZZZ
MSEVELLRELIVHMWVHDGYRMNGYDKMTQAQRVLYDSVVPPPSTRVDKVKR